MAAPSRMYVGVVVSGLIVSLCIVAYVALVLGGYRPPPDTPYEVLFPQDESLPAGEILFLALAGLFAVGFTWVSWRRLLAGARADARKRRQIRELRKELAAYKRQNEQPPGFT